MKKFFTLTLVVAMLGMASIASALEVNVLVPGEGGTNNNVYKNVVMKPLPADNTNQVAALTPAPMTKVGNANK